MKRARMSLLLCMTLVIASSSYSQDQRRNGDDQRKASDAPRVTLDFSVVNKRMWNFIGGLKKEDVSIYEHGVKQEIIEFNQSERPLSIVLLVDLSGSMHEIIEPTRLVSLQALLNLKPEDEVAVITFAKKSLIVQNFTKDKELIRDRISRLTVNKDLGRSTALDEAIYQAAVYLRANSSAEARRIIFVITDNIAQRYPEHFKKAALRELAGFGGIVCSLLVPNSSEWEGRRRFPAPPQPPQVGQQSRTSGVPSMRSDLPTYLSETGNIETYVKETGGIVLHFEEDETGARRAAMMNLFRNYYTVGYQSSTVRRDGTFRKIKLKISPDVEKREGSLMILSRQGYQAN